MRKRLQHQAAGHPDIYAEGDLVFKYTNETELRFYDEVYMSSAGFSTWMPLYKGRMDLGVSEQARGSAAAVELERCGIRQPHLAESKPILLMENLLDGFSKPSIIDIKLGKQLTDLGDASVSQEKHARLQQVANSTTTSSLHLRICGMEIYNEDFTNDSDFFKIDQKYIIKGEYEQENYIKIDKFLGRDLTDTTFKDCLKFFFCNNEMLPHNYRDHLVAVLVKRLSLMYNDLFDLPAAMFSTSLLIIYENDLSKIESKRLKNPNTGEAAFDDPIIKEHVIIEEGDSDNEEDAKSFLSSVNMIDFAHSKLLSNGQDENVLDALENLIQVLQQIEKEEKEK